MQQFTVETLTWTELLIEASRHSTQDLVASAVIFTGYYRQHSYLCPTLFIRAAGRVRIVTLSRPHKLES